MYCGIEQMAKQIHFKEAPFILFILFSISHSMQQICDIFFCGINLMLSFHVLANIHRTTLQLLPCYLVFSLHIDELFLQPFRKLMFVQLLQFVRHCCAYAFLDSFKHSVSINRKKRTMSGTQICRLLTLTDQQSGKIP